MNKKIIAFCTIMLAIAFTSSARERIIPSASLPGEIKTYIAANFPKQSIRQSITELDGFTKTYEIILDNLTELEFNRKGEITSIDGKIKLPASVISTEIAAYIKSNYPGSFITGWHLDDRNQEIELNNGLDLEFNMNGLLLRIDN